MTMSMSQQLSQDTCSYDSDVTVAPDGQDAFMEEADAVGSEGGKKEDSCVAMESDNSRPCSPSILHPKDTLAERNNGHKATWV